MTSQEQLRDITDATAYDNDGDKLGKIGQVYFDDDTDQPKWITVNTGLFGMNESFVPLQGATFDSDRVTVAYDKATIKDAPHISGDQHLDVDEERRLYSHYRLDGATSTTDSTTDSGVAGNLTGRHAEGDPDAHRERDLVGQRGVGHDTSGPNTDEAMTRSEEQLRVGTETRETGRARLRKHVVTENVSTTVPVSREEVTLEREPITEANRGDALTGGDLTEEEHEVTLTEQRAVVDKETVPVERVRLGTETVTGQEQVDETVRKEVIDTDGVEDTREVADRDVAGRDRTGR